MILQVARTFDRERVVKHGVVTVPGEWATLDCRWGMRVNTIPLRHRALQRELLEVGKLFIQRQGKRGLQYLDHEDIHVYGPFPSKEYHEALLTPDQLNVSPKEAAALVKDRATEIGAYADYVLVAAFLAKPIETLVWTPARSRERTAT